MTNLHTILRQQRGRYLWGVRSGEGSLLSWQVGEPHLHIEMGRHADGLERRHAEPRGRWEVEILDGEVVLQTPIGNLILSGDHAAPAQSAAVLSHLQGQALVGVDRGAQLVLRFDLETELRVHGPRAWVRVAGPDGEAEWSPS